MKWPKYVLRVSQSTTKVEVASRLCRDLNLELGTREGKKDLLPWELRSFESCTIEAAATQYP